MYGEGKTRGNVSIIKSQMATNQACCNIELDEDLVDYEYVYYFLKTQYQELRNLSSGVRKNLNSNDIKTFIVRFSKEISKQQKIVTVLSTLDTKIDCNNRINAELEAMAKTLYDYWFVQFDFLDENGRPYKSSGGKMVYNPTLKREIPAGWKDGSLWDIARYFNGLAMQKFRPKGEEYLPVIKIKEMSDGITKNSEKASPDITKNAVVEDTGHHGLVGDAFFHGLDLDGGHISFGQSDVDPAVFAKGCPGNFPVFFFTGFQVVHRQPLSGFNRSQNRLFFFIESHSCHFYLL